MFQTVLDNLPALLGGHLSFKIMLARLGTYTPQIPSCIRTGNLLIRRRYTFRVSGIFRPAGHCLLRTGYRKETVERESCVEERGQLAFRNALPIVPGCEYMQKT